MAYSYKDRKEAARQEAIEWQLGFADRDYSYEELAAFANHFRELGRKYGLLSDFRENGII